MKQLNNEVKYLETGGTNPYYNLAFEEFVLTNKMEGDYLILWQNDNTIVIGQNQNTEAEINKECVEENSINVVRRSTGGGAVYHDMGNLNYSFITDVEDAEKLTMERFTRPIVSALKSLGLGAEASGRNDIVVDGKKVSGTAQRIYKTRILHHGTLLFDSNPEILSAALNADPDKFKSKSAKSVKSRIGNIKEMLPEDKKSMTLPRFWAHILKELTLGGMERARLTEDELAKVEELKKEKYDTWEWNYGRSPRFDMSNKERFEGGSIEVLVSVKREGIIEDIKFYGDFLSKKPLDELIYDLKGRRFEAAEIEAALDCHNLADYFGSISKGEIVKLLFR